MVHEWTVTRLDPEGDAILGTLDTHGGATCYTLERASLAIPEGRYRLTLTESARAKRGELWAPGSDFTLPLVNDVPGRTGIRMHAGNTEKDSVGCLLLGAEIHGVTLSSSRPCVTRIVNTMHSAARDGDDIFLTVGSVKTPGWAKGPQP